MVYFPIRKCYHAIKVTVLLILVIAVLGLFERWRGGKRGSSAFSDPDEADFENQILEDEARIVPGLGEGGIAAYLTGQDKKKGEESEKRLAMNVYLSDRIAYNRSLKDNRNPACSRVLYDAELPSASVILIFHNEPYSVVIRTVWSVINSCRRDNSWFRKANFVDANGDTMKLGYRGQKQSSSLVYLKEIILVDDNSTLPELKGKLSHYVRTRLPPDLIRILRLPDRVGLTRARLAGARYAVGDVLVFLDSHCEPQPDWLRPLLYAVKKDPHAVVVPIIDVIDSSTFYYSVQDPVTFQVGGFTFTGHFNWIDVPEREKIRRGSDISPTWSPTMAGGLFAINRAYYWELGAYDEQMAGWGGENLEMSFRIWQCGGTLETIPCSRVGHVFRSFHPYGLPAHTDTHGINTARMAEVWMDEYAELFYLYRPDLRKNPKIGDVTHRKVLREKLQCKSFQWYLDNIYKEKFVPVRDAYGYGRFMNPNTGLCLDTLQREADESPLGVYQCHKELQATQYFVLSLNNELRGEDDCAHVMYRSHSSQEADDQSKKVVMSPCRGKQREQKWVYVPESRQIKHTGAGLCLDSGSAPGQDVLLRPCEKVRSQEWNIDYSEDNDFTVPNEVLPSDLQKRLHRLRGQKRHSRSLLSFSDTNAVNSTIRRHTHKKHKKKSKKSKKIKNKFILKLVRSLPNKTEDHLEVDIHCKHSRLYPNNTFVRDLVTILNEKDIKIINNGRVFERNKVSQLDPRAAQDVPGGLPDPPLVTELRKTTKKSHHKKYVPPPLENAPPAPPESPPSARAHRIIIEDFVQLTPTTRAAKRMKKRHRKRPPAPLATPAPPPTPPASDASYHLLNKNLPSVQEQLNTPIQSYERAKETSVEDTPMISGSERDDDNRARQSDTDLGNRARENDASDLAEWTLDEPRFRNNDNNNNNNNYNSSDLGARRNQHSPDEDNESISDAERPVRMMLRSNVTFSLPEELFDWKRPRVKSPPSNPPLDLSIPISKDPLRDHSDDVTDTKLDVKPDVIIDLNDLTDGKDSKDSSNSDSSSAET